MKTGKTNQSAKLRSGPKADFPFIDELEPGYPLVIHGNKNGWLDVTAKAQGKRSEDQRGWIAARLVTTDKPKPKPFQPEPEFDRRPWIIASIAIALGVAIIILSSI